MEKSAFVLVISNENHPLFGMKRDNLFYLISKRITLKDALKRFK